MALEQGRFAGADAKFYSVHKAGGINTREQRQVIQDNQFSWLENLQPIADGNFRALYSNGTALYTAPGGRSIIYIYPFNIGTTNYIAVLLDNGQLDIRNTDANTTVSLTTTPGVVYPGTKPDLPMIVQYGSSSIIGVSTGSTGYFIYDGKSVYAPGSLAPGVAITNNGSNYVTAPQVSINGGSGTGATAVAGISGGQVSTITLTNPGSGYLPGDVVTVSISGGQTTGTGANLTAVLTQVVGGSGGVLTPTFSAFTTGAVELTAVAITTPGTGYSNFVKATFGYTGLPGNWFNFAPPTLTVTQSGGAIATVTINYSSKNPLGVWYQNGGGNPTIVVSDPGFYFVSSVTVVSGGTNYSPSAKVTASAGGSPVQQATLTPVIASGVITSVTVNNGGIYGSNTPPTLAVADSPVVATAIVSLMPFGISGTCIEVYQGRVWIGNGNVIQFTAPNSNTDFTVADGAGAFQSTDSFLRVQWTALKQFGPYLYLFADSSINVISNVQFSGSTTTFNNQNLDPMVGTPWPNSVKELNGALYFANTIGVYSLQGSHVQKVSDDLNGIFAAAFSTLAVATPPNYPSSTLVTLNEVPVYGLIVPVQAPFDGSPRNAFVMYDGQRWWVGSQVTGPPVFASLKEVNSVLLCAYTDGTTVRQGFITKSSSLTKYWQTKLWGGEAPYITRQMMRLFTLGTDLTSGGYSFTGTADYGLEGTAVLTQAVTVGSSNLTGSGSQAANVRGNYVGLTLSTTKDDFVLMGQWLLYQEQSPLGA